jgi:predicted RNA binding protein YcfA (HicA-like mRNA interferase family)
MNKRKLLAKALIGSKNLRFAEAVRLAEAFGFRLSRTRGSHNVFVHPILRELVNLQEVGGKAKPYQVRQLLDGGEV